MKSSIWYLAIPVIAALVCVAGCKKEECPRNEAAHGGYGKTQIVTDGNFRVAFNFMGKKGHEEMLKGFNLDRNILQKADRFVLITLMDKTDRKLVMDARVNVEVTGPSGKTQNSAAKAVTGGGMHHYVTGFAAADKGEYRVFASINAKGGNAKAEASYGVE